MLSTFSPFNNRSLLLKKSKPRTNILAMFFMITTVMVKPNKGVRHSGSLKYKKKKKMRKEQVNAGFGKPDTTPKSVYKQGAKQGSKRVSQTFYGFATY